MQNLAEICNRAINRLPRLPRHLRSTLRPQPIRSFQKLPAWHAGSFPITTLGRALPWIALRPFTTSPSCYTRMEANGYARQKRKGSPVNAQDRPTKLFKPARSDTVNSDHSIDDQDMYDREGISDTMIDTVATTGENAEWQATIEKVVKNVVSIHFCQTCSFDTSSALSSEATGFIVDAEKGYILTNRHVVGSGPFWGYCIFDNHEEAGSIPINTRCATLTPPFSAMYTLSIATLYMTSAFYVLTPAKSSTCKFQS